MQCAIPNKTAPIRQALIPAAGRGLRLDRPGTPKPLVDVDGQGMIVRVIGQLYRAGIKRVVVVVGYDGDKIERELTRHPALTTRPAVVTNPDWSRGLASSIVSAQGALTEGDPFLIAMADHVFDDELIGLIAATPPPPDGVCALVDPRLEQIFALEPAVKVRLDESALVDIGRELDQFDAVDTGLFVADWALFDELRALPQDGHHTNLTHGVAALARRGRATAIRAVDGSWDDVDTPADLIHAEMRLRSKRRQAQIEHPSPVALDLNRDQYAFIAGQPVETTILVHRGVVAEPQLFPLIPVEAASSPIFVFTDETVGELYGNTFIRKLKHQGYHVHSIVLPDGEESKSLANYVYLVERVLSRGVDERSVFISLGGGVVCNVCGFIASTIYRGLGLIHLPTTLMAQCDAAISHKQAINGYRGKNMVGSYYSPLSVVADVEVLATLPDRLKGDGIAEAIKHALGQDPAYVELLMSHQGEVNDPDFLEQIVRRNVELKCGLATSDPKELREAMILQYGHTVGHPIEHLSGYSFYHGESVAIGMMVAARVSRLLGGCTDELVETHGRLCDRYGLPTTIPRSIHVGDILESMRYNKRYLTEGTRMALLTDVGRLWHVDGDYAIPVSDTVLEQAIELSREEQP